MKIKNAVILALLLVVILLVGGIYTAHKISLLPPYSPVATTTTTTSTTNTAYQPPYQAPLVTPAPTTLYNGTYHNGVYGLTLNLPVDYQAFDTGSSPAGVVASDSIDYTENGTEIFSINIFTKQQWNTIRTEENTEHLDVNDLGEGTYLGENETYIFSYNISSPTNAGEVQGILSTIRYY
jgi:hypothetical protein